MSNEVTHLSKKFINDIKHIVHTSRTKAYSAINIAQVEANWLVGKRIVEEEQGGNERAKYGAAILKKLSEALTETFGKGFTVSQLYYCRQFYTTFPTIFDTPCRILSWSHYKRLLRIDDNKAREWYAQEASREMWSYRTLDRNINTQYYHRLLLSTNKKVVVEEMEEKTELYQQDKLEFIKNPMVTEFLGLSSNRDFTESELESAIINNLQKFLMELGKGFAFVARQQLIRTEAEDYFIDLVFYNYILKCFVLIDLKTTKINHQDVGQMDMYIRMYDELRKGVDDNPTIGIVLCSQTDEDIARYSILKGNEQLFASKYKLYLPTEEELKAEIERQKILLSLQFDNEQL